MGFGSALLTGCDASSDSAAKPPETVTTTVTTRVTAPPPELPRLSGRKLFPDLVWWLRDEYGWTTVRNLARTICKEIRTGERDPSLPWRAMINYTGKRDVGAFIAYSVAAYCPETGADLIDN